MFWDDVWSCRCRDQTHTKPELEEKSPTLSEIQRIRDRLFLRLKNFCLKSNLNVPSFSSRPFPCSCRAGGVLAPLCPPWACTPSPDPPLCGDKQPNNSPAHHPPAPLTAGLGEAFPHFNIPIFTPQPSPACPPAWGHPQLQFPPNDLIIHI